MCNGDGSDPLPLTKSGGESSWPSWSPDGTRVAFTSASGGDFDIYTVSVHGGDLQRLTANPSGNAAAKLVARRLDLLLSIRTGNYQIWKIPGAGGEAVPVTKQGGSTPSVSPDGKFVYYAKGEDEVWRIPTAGGEEMRFINGVDRPGHGRWAPVDGGFYFVQRRGSKRALTFLDLSTGRTSEVMALDRPWDVFALPISADRRWLLYGQIDYTDHDLMVVENFR